MLAQPPCSPTASFEPTPKSAATEPFIELPTGLQRYITSEELGRGGWGVVLRATDRQLDRDVAIKKLNAQAAKNADLVNRFLHEGLITAKLQHPNIVPIYERGYDHNVDAPYYAMKLLDGVTLEHEIDRYHHMCEGAAKRAQFHKLIDCFIDICQAMAYAHRQRIIHRDLKPSNIVVGSFGETVIVDWGLAKQLPDTTSTKPSVLTGPNNNATVAIGVPCSANAGDPSELASPDASSGTRMGTIVGTPSYMAPEQAKGSKNEVGVASDVYSLGIILFEILTGTRPFHGATVEQTLSNVIAGKFTRPRLIDRKIAKPLESICLHAIRYDPTQRYADAQELADDVNRFLAGEPIAVHRESIFERGKRICRHRPIATATLFVSTLAIAVASILTSVVVHRAHQQEQQARFEAVAAHAHEQQIRQQAQLARESAHQRLEQTQRHMRDWTDRLNRMLGNFPAMEPVRREWLNASIQHHRDLYEDLLDQPQSQLEQMECLLRIGQLQLEAVDIQAAQTTFLIVDAMLTDHAEMLIEPRSINNDHAAAQTGLLHCKLKLKQDFSKDLSRLRRTLVKLLDVFKLHAQADSHPQESSTIETLAKGYLAVGQALSVSDDHRSATVALKQALHLGSMLSEQSCSNEQMHLLIAACQQMATTCKERDDLAEAINIVRTQIDYLDHASGASTSRFDLLEDRATAWLCLGQLHRQIGNEKATVDAFCRGLQDLVNAWQQLDLRKPQPTIVDKQNLDVIVSRCLELIALQIKRYGDSDRLQQWAHRLNAI